MQIYNTLKYLLLLIYNTKKMIRIYLWYLTWRRVWERERVGVWGKRKQSEEPLSNVDL